MRKLILVLTFGLLLSLGLGSVAIAHDGEHLGEEFCGHGNHYSNYAWGYGSYGAYTWDGYLGHGDYANHYGGTTHWHLYEVWEWSDYYWSWYFWDYEWRQC